MRILVVDDNTDLADNLAEILEDEGHSAVVAYDAAAALAQCEQFDAALIDVKMDGMDGVELCRLYRQRCPNTRCVLMTAYARDDRLEAAKKMGTVVLTKPLEPSSLLRVLFAA